VVGRHERFVRLEGGTSMIPTLVRWVRAQNETTQSLVVAGTLGLSVVMLVVIIVGVLT
jgi:hypothetical protein